MRALTAIALLAAPLGTLGAPAAAAAAAGLDLAPRQGGQAKFCQRMDPAPSVAETEARHNKFATAFIVDKDIDEAFSYIAPEYINNGRASPDGAQRAYDFLKPLWAGQNITVIRTLFRENMGWLNYRSGLGTIVDRYRWEQGCIVEHWDAGEKMPAD